MAESVDIMLIGWRLDPALRGEYGFDSQFFEKSTFKIPFEIASQK